jgi:uncharacterized protein (TIGR02284 family)
MTNSKTLKAMHDLAATCNDAAEGYGKAAKGVHDKELSNWLAQASADRERFAAEIENAIRHMGDQPRQDWHEGGILHKGWVDLDQRLRSTEPHLHSKDDKQILRECTAGDSGTLKHYDFALAQDLKQDVREMVIEQRTAVDDNLAYLQNLVDGKQRTQGA